MTRNSVDDPGTAQAPPLVVSPLGLVVFLVALSVILRRRGPALIGLIRAVGLLASCDRRPALGALEADYPHRSIESTETRTRWWS